MNIENINQTLKFYRLQEFPLDFEKQLNNSKFNNTDKSKIIKALEKININGDNPLIIILRKNHTEKLELKNNDIINLINIYPEQLLIIDMYGRNSLLYLLRYNKEEELGFTSKNIIDLINKYPEQLLQIDKDGLNPLILILANNKTQKLGFSFEYINNIYEKQIDKEYNYNDINNKKRIVLFNESYILNKLNFLNCELTFYHEFLDYRKTLLEKRNITNILEINQKEIKNTSIFSSNLIKI